MRCFNPLTQIESGDSTPSTGKTVEDGVTLPLNNNNMVNKKASYAIIKKAFNAFRGRKSSICFHDGLVPYWGFGIEIPERRNPFDGIERFGVRIHPCTANWVEKGRKRYIVKVY